MQLAPNASKPQIASERSEMPTAELAQNLQSKAWRDAHIKPSRNDNPDWLESDEVHDGGY
jgi:hypothetical protein